MADLLAEAAQWLADQVAGHCASIITYKRGEQSVEVAAAVGSTVWQVQGDDGLMREFEGRDFLIRAADLDFGSGPVEPAAGDRIEVNDGGTVRTYEVAAPGDEPPWRWSDRYHKVLRVHTKQVEEA